jgi:transposase
VRVWIATGHTDMRRGMNSLAVLVQEAFKRDPHGGDLYVFRGKHCYTSLNLTAEGDSLLSNSR